MLCRISLAVPLFLLLASCTNLQRSSVNPLQLDGVPEWSFEGKIAVQYPRVNCNKDECSPQSDQGGIRWQQRGRRFKIVITDPFGKILSTTTGNRQVAQVRDGKGTKTVSPNRLIERILHLPIDMRTVQLWVTGRHDATLPSPERTAEGFRQQKVMVEPSLWRTIPKLGKMPSKVILRAGKHQVRIVIKSWSRPEKAAKSSK